MSGLPNLKVFPSIFKPVTPKPISSEPISPTPKPETPWITLNGKNVITKDGLELVKEFEGLYLSAYLDPVNVPTIAYGRTYYPNGKKVQLGDTCTKEEALEWLIYDLEHEGAKFVRAWVKRELTPNEWSALVSFIFNRGAGRFQEKLLGIVNQGDKEAAAECMKTYNWAGKPPKVLRGLTRRRYAEAAMFLGKNWRQFT